MLKYSYDDSKAKEIGKSIYLYIYISIYIYIYKGEDFKRISVRWLKN